MQNYALKNYRQYLFCPGPVNVATNVKEAAVSYEIGHREKEFSVLLKSINQKLQKLYQSDKSNDYHTVVITGSATAANESILSSIGEKNVLVIANGEFGERLHEISLIHNKNTSVLRFGWAEKINIAQVEKNLKERQIDVVVMVHHETSTGMLNPIQEIGKLIKKYKKIFIVDTVSSAGAEDINIVKCNITFASGSAGKALGAFPGLSYVIGQKTAFKSLKNNPPKTAYLNLYKFYLYSKDFAQTPNTPSVNSFFALDQALANIEETGIKNHLRSLKETSKKLRKNMKKLGFKFLINEKYMSSVLTTVILPSHIPVLIMKTMLRKKNIIIYNGKGPLKDKVFQVGNIGVIGDEYVNYFLESLREISTNLKQKPISKLAGKHSHSSVKSFLVTSHV